MMRSFFASFALVAAMTLASFAVGEPPAMAWRVSDIPMPLNPGSPSLYGAEPHAVAVGSGPLATIYVAGHAHVGAPGDRSPVWVTVDNGTRWNQIDSVRQTAGVEGHLVTDGADRAWLYDMTGPGKFGTTMPLFGWCSYGHSECSYQPDVYDAVQSASGPSPCSNQTVTTDRPWIAYRPGKLLLVNNGGRAEIGLFDLATSTKSWNTCPDTARGFPGVPSIRASDGLFVVPMARNDSTGDWFDIYRGTSLSTITRTSAIFKLAPKALGIQCKLPNFPVSTVADSGRFYGGAASDPHGRIRVVSSTDLVSFAQAELNVGDHVRDLWLTGSRTGDGALLTYTVLRDCLSASTFKLDYYARHVTVVSGVVTFGPEHAIALDVASVCADYSGSTLGATGTAYIPIWTTSAPGSCTSTPGEAALHLYVQDTGPRI